MLFYNLSKHGILTGCLTLSFFIMMSILAGIRINEIDVLTEKYKDFQDYPPLNEQDLPIGVLVVSLIMIIITCLMIMGIFKKSHLFMAPWILIFIIGIIGQVVYYVHHLVRYYSLHSLLFFSFITGTQILILSPIIILFDNIRFKNIELNKTKKESIRKQEGTSDESQRIKN